MKVKPFSYGTMEIIPENDAERIWLGQWLANFPKNHMPFMSNYIRVDLEGSCVITKGKNEYPAEDCDIEQVINEEGTDTWGMVEKVKISSFGFYIQKEEEKRIEKLNIKKGKRNG